MCGITACINFDEPIEGGEQVVRRMNDVLIHRGPDGEGVYVAPGNCAVIGSRRLSIVDDVGGAMPMRVTHEEKEYVIVSNGEFFNHNELREVLKQDFTFITRSDTEVALYAYIKWGDACVERLRGQFAFIIYDDEMKSVFLARDRVGIKPLYYALLGNTLLVSSEPKGILSYTDFKRRPDARTIADYFLGILTIGKSESLDGSFFEGIKAIPPGHVARFGHIGLVITEYYRPVFTRHSKELDQTVDEMRREVTRSIQEQIPQEVLYGIPLSGGLDSSIVTVVAARAGQRPRVAACVRYEGSNNSDFEHAVELAKREHIQLIAPVLGAAEVLGELDNLILALDRPYESSRDLGLANVYRNLHDSGVKVALIGEGADEFNLGYFYRLPGFSVGGKECQTADGFRALLHSRVDAVVSYFTPEFISPDLVKELVEYNVRTYYEQPMLDTPLDKMQYYYIKKFLKGRLDVQDRSSMWNSVEARVPFCDEEVISVSLKVPPERNLVDGAEKVILRSAFKEDLPESIARRTKSPLPESESVNLYRMTLDAYDKACRTADPSVWNYLNKSFADTLRTTAETHVVAAERGEKVASGDGMSILAPVDFRMRRLFVVLTFIRWYDLYFVKNVFL